MIEWLPELLELESYSNDWSTYFDAVYDVFLRDFVNNHPVFRGKKLGLKKYPEFDGKSATFWHFISEGSIESERTPDLRRCERIAWPARVIEKSAEPAIKCWENERNGEKRIVLWLASEDYVVILTERKGYILPWTAYIVTHRHTREKLERQYQASKKAGSAPC